LTISKSIYFLTTIGFLALGSCQSIKTVGFEMSVDTTSKPIYIQTKQTYQLNDVGVFASNEFEGAHLNGFEKVNDSTALVIISPENIPINNSAYYAFKT